MAVLHLSSTLRPSVIYAVRRYNVLDRRHGHASRQPSNSEQAIQFEASGGSNSARKFKIITNKKSIRLAFNSTTLSELSTKAEGAVK